MRSWTIAFCAGVLLAAQLPELPLTNVSLAALLVAALLSFWRVLRLPSAVLLGAAWLCLNANNALQQRWPEPPFPRDAWVEATVWTLPVPSGTAQRSKVRLDKVCLAATISACEFSTLPFDGRFALLTNYEPVELQPGQRWRWLLRLKPPHGLVNPGGFDYEAWLMQQQLSATGYVRHEKNSQLLTPDSGERSLEAWRQRLVEILANESRLQRPDLLRALTVGDGSSISASDWQLLAATGTTHLLVISGSHLALICMLFYTIGYWAVSRSAWLLLRVPATLGATTLALVGSWFYAGLAGFSLPIQRACVMATVLLLAQAWRRQLNSWRNLALCLLAILAMDPLAVLNVGFWLSFIAVGALLSLLGDIANTSTLPWWQRVIRWLWQLWLAQWRIGIALLPIVLLWFQQTSVLAPFVNLPLVPLVGFVIVPLALAGLLLTQLWYAAGMVPIMLADTLLQCCMQWLQWSHEQLPASLVALPSMSMLGVALLILLSIGFLWAHNHWQRTLVLLLLPLLFWWQALPPMQPGQLRLVVMDTGQGLAAIISTRNHHLLYDTGPLFSERFDAGKDVVLPVLRQLNINELDRVMVSHSDQDHAGGLASVLQEFPDAHYSSAFESWQQAPISAELCRAGQHWRWDAIDFRVLHPDGERYDDNNSSCVLHISTGKRSLLLTGDIERAVELRLVTKHPDLRVDVLVTPHHGSNTSSSWSFINSLHPQIAIHSAGYQNRFGHPAKAVKQRYQQLGTAQFTTADAGAITVLVNTDGALSVSGQRKSSPHFWR